LPVQLLPSLISTDFLAMFRMSGAWRGVMRNSTALPIVDGAAADQYLYPEFLLAKNVRTAGITATSSRRQVTGPHGRLYLGAEKIDLITTVSDLRCSSILPCNKLI